MIESQQQCGRSHICRVVVSCQGDLQQKARRLLPAGLREQAGVSDLVQETSLRAMRSWRTCRGTTYAEIRTWLYSILRNHLINLVRRWRSAEKLEHSYKVPSKRATETPSCIAMAKEEQLMMESAFHRLTEEEQRLLASYLRDGCTFSELGHQFGCSEEAARKRWGRALFRWQQMTQAHHA